MPQVPKLQRGAKVEPRRREDGLAFTYAADGRPAALCDLTAWSGSEALRCEAVEALTKMTDVDDGCWRAQATIDDGLMYVRLLLRWCEGQGIESFSQFTEAEFNVLNEQQEDERTRNSYLTWAQYTRRFLQYVPELPAGLRMRARGRIGSPDDDGTRTYYSAQQVRDLDRAATRVLAKARSRVTANLATVQRVLNTGEATPAEELLLSIWSGEFNSKRDGDRKRRLLAAPQPATGPVTVDHYFMLTQQEVVAAAALLVCRTGWNRSVVTNLTTGSWSASTGADEDIATVSLDKARRRSRRHSTNVLVDNGPSSQGSAWRMVVEATEPTRLYLAERGISTDALLLRSAGGRHARDTLYKRVRVGLPTHHLGRLDWLPADMVLDFPVLRRTHQTIIDRSPTQNTFAVHVRSYLLKNPDVQDEMYAIAAEGQRGMVDRAEESLAVRLSAEYEVPDDILAGHKDTATMACKDINHHPITGLPCTENFLTCLMCDNAVATPRHLPRLVLLHSALEDLRGAVTESVWSERTDDYLRLTAFLFNSAQLNDDTYQRHLQAATKSDRQNVRDLLGGNLDA